MRNDKQKLDSYEKILEMALKKEKAAYLFYENHAKKTKARVLQKIFEELRDEEAKHVNVLQRKLDEIRYS